MHKHQTIRLLLTGLSMALVVQALIVSSSLAQTSQHGSESDKSLNRVTDQKNVVAQKSTQLNKGDFFWKGTISLAEANGGYITEDDFEKAFGVRLMHHAVGKYGSEASLIRNKDWYASVEYALHFKDNGRDENLDDTRIEYSRLLLGFPNAKQLPNDCINAKTAVNDLLRLGWVALRFLPPRTAEFVDQNMISFQGKKNGAKISLFYESSIKQPPYIKVDPASACVSAIEIWGTP